MNDDIMEYWQTQFDRNIVLVEAEKSQKELLTKKAQEELIKNIKNKQRKHIPKKYRPQKKHTTNKQKPAKQT